MPARADEPDQIQARIYRSLRHQLAFGDLTTGQPVSVRHVAEAHGASFTPARDAVRRLVWEHALQVRPNGRFRVPVLDAAEIEMLRDQSKTVEALLLERALPRLDHDKAAEIFLLTEASDRLLRKGDTREGLRRLRQARGVLMAEARTPWLLDAYDQILVRRSPHSALFYLDFLKAAPPFRAPWQLIAALERDLAAARDMLWRQTDAFFDHWQLALADGRLTDAA